VGTFHVPGESQPGTDDIGHIGDEVPHLGTLEPFFPDPGGHISVGAGRSGLGKAEKRNQNK
jgi:hypothetical protein